MRNSVLVTVFLGCFCISGTSAIMPLLGEAIEHPLFFWGPQHLIYLFDMNGTLGEQCVGFEAINSLTGVFKCASLMQNIASMATGDSIPSPTGLCSSISSFTTCIQEESMKIADTCGFTDEQRTFVNNAVQNNQDITESLCKDEGNNLFQYILNSGMQCADSSKEGLLQCVNDNDISKSASYNEEGCRKANNFVTCAAQQIRDCNPKAGEIVEEVMNDGLHNVCEPNEGTGALPLYEDSSEEEDEDDFQRHDGRREHRGKKDKLMQKQTQLLEEIRDLLQTTVDSLPRHEDLLNQIAGN